MEKKAYSFLILFLTSYAVWAQEPERRLLKGKIVSEASELEGIYVMNLASEKAILTGKSGYFTIPAKAGDTLMFSSVQIKGRQIRLQQADIDSELFFVPLQTMFNQLDEVKIVQYKNINAVALGIVPAGIKRYTPAERKLHTADGGRTQRPVDQAYTTVGLDQALNWMSGRTAMLKKEVEVEKKESLLLRIADMFEEKYFTETLKIPADYVRGFQYYIVEDVRFTGMVNAKNKAMATFLMGELAAKYIELIAVENK